MVAAKVLPVLVSRDALTIRRIVKVNHAGEHGAIQIYSAQIAIARWFCPDIVSTLQEMLGHEIEHRAKFRAAMASRAARPCRIMAFWSIGGWLLGSVTAVMGNRSIWVCTAAVEETVHRHLDEQLKFLADRDRELHDIIASIRLEEMAHLACARANIVLPGLSARVLTLMIAMLTDAIIWLSTWGDSTRMARELRSAQETTG
jgi:3-demethoxyubiquinol 3-hydroxylase